eukprot:gene5424-15567_t
MDRAVFLGKGSSGRVYEVPHIPSGSLVVIKEIPVHEERQREEIGKELETLSDKCGASRFIVKFLGAFFKDGVVNIAMERMNCSLADVLKLGTVPEDVLRAVTRHALQGLIFLHQERRRAHRDIKPSNLLLDRNS